MKKIFKFVITGGPCSGKTTALETLKDYFSKKGYKVIIVNETATEVINSGILPKDIPVNVFQKVILDRGILKEDTTEALAKYYDRDTIIFYDRGIMDIKAYMSDSGFIEILKTRNLTEEIINNRYDAVFYLVTAANGAENFYTLENNNARSESIEEAIRIDKRTYDVWKGYKRLHKFDSSTSFDEKIEKLIKKVEEEIEFIDF